MPQKVKNYKSAKEFEKDQKKMQKHGYDVITVEAEGKKPYSIARGAGGAVIFGPLGLIGGRGRKGKIMVVYEKEEVSNSTRSSTPSAPLTVPKSIADEVASQLSETAFTQIRELLLESKIFNNNLNEAAKIFASETGQRGGSFKTIRLMQKLETELKHRGSNPELLQPLEEIKTPDSNYESSRSFQSDDIGIRLEKLADLHEKGIITDEEFENKKIDLLSQL
ncbi:MAG: SHOCT domain-containing protein [Actinobacteria bacterium]|nr:SHOCT domain-containing protein [Actinomycetota bacterium]